MAGEKINWRLWQIPKGPEDEHKKKCLLQAKQDEVLAQYQRLREEWGPGALLVTDEKGLAVYACS